MEKNYQNEAYKIIAHKMELAGFNSPELNYDDENNCLWVNDRYQLLPSGRVCIYGNPEDEDTKLTDYLMGNTELIRICESVVVESE